MDANTFRRILTAFADSPANVDLSKGQLLCEVRDEAIEATIASREGELFVTEGGDELPANKWLFQRIARLSILADRIISAFPEQKDFIVPKAELLDQLDQSVDSEGAITGDAVSMVSKVLNRKPVGDTSVIYLTSDAGEGKTTLISHLARRQAESFKQKKTDWLLIPISLGGRPFLRFDDIVVGFLANRLRFPLFYFDGFIELVKLGVLVPAFDGFEEMFVQNASGDALSAVGTLVRTLDSSGAVLIAARKAYFEYQDIKTQVRLFDSIGSCSVAFSRASLKRWEKTEFIEYCLARGKPDPEEIYSRVSDRLGIDHPLLTRAVLVKRLLDVADSVGTLSELLQQIGNSPNDYFAVFVRAIVEREANEKWIDTGGEAAKPLLSVQEHFDLLGSIAQEMWILSTDSLKADVVDLLTEIFCDAKRLSASVAFQVRERTKQHALIISNDSARNSFGFDHEEFKNFFLGEAVGKACVSGNGSRKQELLSLLRRGMLPPQAIQSAVSYVLRAEKVDYEAVAKLLQEVAQLDGPSSFTHENISQLMLRFINGKAIVDLSVRNLAFGSECLRDADLRNVSFDHCSFAPTSLENTHLVKCRFDNCHFERIELHYSMYVSECILADSCEIVSIVPAGKESAVFNPNGFKRLLNQAGFEYGADPQAEIEFIETEEPAVRLLRRLLRHLFLRSTHISERVLLLKLGPGADSFLKEDVPRLLRAGVLEAEWNPRDKQNRYHLGVPMERLNEALSQPNVTLDALIRHAQDTSR